MAFDQIVLCAHGFLAVANGFSCFLASIWSLFRAFCNKTDGAHWQEGKVNEESEQQVAVPDGTPPPAAPPPPAMTAVTTKLPE
jgi:hypothetical protein